MSEKSLSVCRKAKMMFGLKVKKKKKKVNTDLVLANKGALGKAWKTNTHSHTQSHSMLVVCIVVQRGNISCRTTVGGSSPCQTVTC